MFKFIFSLVLSIIIVAVFAKVSDSIAAYNWLQGFIYAAKSTIFLGAFTKSFSIVPSFVLWGMTIGITLWWSSANEKGLTRNYQRSTNVMCAKCDQFLGTGESFTVPCPRCGSNRYYTE